MDGVALVTGAAGDGIGRACAHRLAADGYAVALTDVHPRRTKDAADDLAAVVGIDRVAGVVLDVGDRSSIDAALAAVHDQLGSVDVLVNNAAVNVLGGVADMDPADWDQTVAVDLSGPWYLCRAVLPGMIERGRGAIVNVTSVAAYLGSSREGPYAAAKAALHSLTRSIAAEAGPHGVRCNAVAPGVIESRFVTKYRDTFDDVVAATPLGRIGRADEVAAAVSWLVSEESSFVTGEVINVSGGWYVRP